MTAAKRTIIKNGTLIDGLSQSAVPNTAIIVEGNKISSVGALPPGLEQEAEVVDATGHWIMPGMIDGHVHISSHQGALPGVRFTSTPEYATLWCARIVGQVLNAGVTGISVPGGKWFVDATVRDAVAGGMIEGPRIFCAGRALTPYGGIFDNSTPGSPQGTDDSVGVLCNSIGDYLRETRHQAQRGVSMIKVADSYWGDTQTISLSDLEAVVGEAHRRNLPVCTHSRGSGSTRDAALARVDWIFHADWATEEDLDVVAKKNIPIMPVFTQCQIITEQDENMGFSTAMRDRVKRQLDANYAAIRKARSRGIEILSGTDSGNAAAFAHGAYHGREPELLMKEIGLSPMEAIHACTRRNAKTIGLDGKVGVIGPGMLADIIVWKRDPLADIRVLQQPEQLSMIMKDGRQVERGREGFRALRAEPPRANIAAQG